MIDKFIKDWEYVYNLLEIEEDPTLVKYKPLRRRYAKQNSGMSITRPHRAKLDNKTSGKKRTKIVL